eukprot:g5781.t1
MSSVLAPVSRKEEALRSQLLHNFRRFKKSDDEPNIIHSEDFHHVLRESELPFGHPVVDRLMLLCHINQDGTVDLNRFAEVVELGVRAKAQGFAAPQIHSDVHKLSQADRVKRLAKEIHRLFYQYDSGSSTLSEFRQQLADLGIRETHETKRILRQTPISFRELLNSLARTHNEVPAGVAAGVSRTAASIDELQTEVNDELETKDEYEESKFVEDNDFHFKEKGALDFF